MSETFTENPFSYNFVSLNKSKVNELPIPGRDSIVASSEYSLVGKQLGIENTEGWDKNYDKVFLITEWAKERSGLKEPKELVQWINKMYKYSIPLGSKKIERLYNNVRRIKENG